MLINWYKLLSHWHFGRIGLTEAVLYLVSLLCVRIYLFFLLALNIANWFLAFYVNKNVSQNLVVLHYNVNLGVNLIGPAANIYIIPALGLSLTVINFVLLLNVYRQSKFLIHFLLGLSLLINLFLIASTISVYLINFR
jgi:hypothetical protein